MANTSSFDTKFRTVVTEYLMYLNDGGSRYPLTRQPYQPSTKRYVSAGNLLDCPLKAAKEKLNATAVIPGLLKMNNPTLLLRMLQGTSIAEIFQEAFCWYGENYKGSIQNVEVEKTVENKQLSLRGRLDLQCIYRGDSFLHIVEFKHRLPTYKDKFPQPRIADVFQLLAYMRSTNAEKGHLCIINTPQYSEFFDANKGYSLWELVNATHNGGKDFGWNLINEEGNLWDHPLNTPDYINIMALEQEIERQMMYIEGVEAPPIELHSDEGWQCRKVITKAARGKIGRFKPMCAFYCHDEGQAKETYEYGLNDDGTWSIAW